MYILKELRKSVFCPPWYLQLFDRLHRLYYLRILPASTIKNLKHQVWQNFRFSKFFGYRLLLFLILFSCSQSPMVTTELAIQNKTALMKVKVGMSKEEVLNIMKRPYEERDIKIGETKYQVWFYVTEGLMMGQTSYFDDNFTPVVFKGDKVIGIGERYYRYLINSDNAREKAKEEVREAYTNDKEEWPLNEHKELPEQPKKETPPPKRNLID